MNNLIKCFLEDENLNKYIQYHTIFGEFGEYLYIIYGSSSVLDYLGSYFDDYEVIYQSGTELIVKINK